MEEKALTTITHLRRLEEEYGSDALKHALAVAVALGEDTAEDTMRLVEVVAQAICVAIDDHVRESL